MNKLKLIIAVVLMCLSFHSVADEADALSPLDKYKENSNFYILICPLNYRMFWSYVELKKEQDDSTNYIDCIKKAKATAKINLANALATVTNPKAQEALKSYQVAFFVALDGIVSGDKELSSDYAQRQQRLHDKLNEAWERFEIEQ